MDKREEIKKTALTLFAHKGYGECSMQEIADMLGINKATLYFYFKNKDDLYNSVLKDVTDMYLLRVKKSVRQNENETLEKVLFMVFRAFVTNSNHENLLMWKKTILMSFSNIDDSTRHFFRVIYQQFNTDMYHLIYNTIFGKTNYPREKIELFMTCFYLFTQSFLDWMIFNELGKKKDILSTAVEAWKGFWNGNSI